MIIDFYILNVHMINDANKYIKINAKLVVSKNSTFKILERRY